MKISSHEYVNGIKELFLDNSNIKNAIPMKKYMKNKFEYFGIKKPERELLTRTFFKDYGIPDIDIVENTILELWGLPQRELHYFALLVLDRSFKKYKADYIKLYEKLITTNSWWDTVDSLAARLVANHFETFPDQIISVTSGWIASENIWLKRSALLFQLKYKDKTNTDLLKKYILKCLGSKEFFINKAIGWILREYSKTNSEWVVNFVETTNLEPLSRREALKWLNSRK